MRHTNTILHAVSGGNVQMPSNFRASSLASSIVISARLTSSFVALPITFLGLVISLGIFPDVYDVSTIIANHSAAGTRHGVSRYNSRINFLSFFSDSSYSRPNLYP